MPFKDIESEFVHLHTPAAPYRVAAMKDNERLF
jgi:hypothetical protein